MNDDTTYNTIAEAEAVLVAAGYRRDVNRAAWVSPMAGVGGAVRVIRTPENKFKISRNNA